jgi:hypothetical protein
MQNDLFMVDVFIVSNIMFHTSTRNATVLINCTCLVIIIKFREPISLVTCQKQGNVPGE